MGGGSRQGSCAPFFLSQSPVILAFHRAIPHEIALLAALLLGLFAAAAGAQESSAPHNVIIFVADGLRYGSVEPGNMPNMARLKHDGVDFTNSHSLYPTITTVNASAIATGHYIGDTGDFGNTLYTGQPMASLKGSTLGFLENDTVLAEMNQKFGGNYLGETTLDRRRPRQGLADRHHRQGRPGPHPGFHRHAGSQTLILDDSTGHDGGIGLPGWFKARHETGVRRRRRARSLRAEYRAGSLAGESRDPHRAAAFQGQRQSLSSCCSGRAIPTCPSITAATASANITPASTAPAARPARAMPTPCWANCCRRLKQQGLDKTTDIFVTADHGFTTISHDGDGRDLPSSFPGRRSGQGAEPADAQPGFLGKRSGRSRCRGRGQWRLRPDLSARRRTPKSWPATLSQFLPAQNYVSGIFVNDTLGKFHGACR